LSPEPTFGAKCVRANGPRWLVSNGVCVGRFAALVSVRRLWLL